MKQIVEMKYILNTLILLSFTNKLFSQSTSFDIKAVVVDQNDSLVFGNIIALSPSDSSIIKGSYFLDGKAELLDVKEVPVLVKFSSVGYNDTIISVDNANNQKLISLGKIVMVTSSQELGEVTVSATIPLFESSDEGGVIVNVKKTMLGSSTSLLEILSKSPNVVVNGNGVSVIGRGEALIYLEGKRITFEQLGSIAVQSVQKVDIISNPSAKFDAEGRAVINIVLVPNPKEGFQFGIVQNAIFARHFLYAPALTVNYRKGKFSLNGNYSLLMGRDWTDGTVTRDVSTANGVFSSSKDEVNNDRSTYVGNHSIGIGYQFNQNHEMSFEYSGLYNLYDLDIVGDNAITDPGNSVQNLRTRNYGTSTDVNNSFSLNYNGTLDTLGSSVFVGAMSSDFTNELNDLIDERSFLNEVMINTATRNNVGYNNISLNTIQADISKNFKNNTTLDFGAKYGDARNQSKIDLFSREEGGEFVPNPLYSNEFSYTEKIPAAYAQFHGSLGKKVGYSVGVRTEYSMVTGFSSTLNQTVLDTTYLNFFPNADLSYQINESWNLGLSLSSRISRPKYQDLDPFLWYQDSLTSIQGNPFIVPELIHGGELTVRRNGISLSSGYFYSTNPSSFVIFPGNSGDGSVILRKENFEAKQSFVTTLAVPFNHKIYSTYNSVSLGMNQYIDSRPDFQVGDIFPQLNVYSYNSFSVKNWFDIELIIDYEGAKDDGLFQDDHRYSLSVGLAKYMMDGNMTLRFLANDALRTYRVTGSSDIGQVRSTYDARLNTVFYRFSLIYFFGKLKEVNYNNEGTSSDEIDRLKL